MLYKINLFIIISVLITIAFFIGVKNGQLQEDLYQAPKDDKNLVQWRKDWREAGDSIVNASIVVNSSDKLFVYVDYIYSGSHGKTVTTCGTILNNGKGGNWSCSPTGIGKGRGFMTLRFGLSSKAREIECSDEILISFYDNRGVTFFEHKVPFKKTWVKNGGQNITGKIRESVSLCP